VAQSVIAALQSPMMTLPVAASNEGFQVTSGVDMFGYRLLDFALTEDLVRRYI
jgi:hypothetical protein